tara:strand:+ start:1403 stop:1915 length:513 start_codon:yes stop_codon:yes gene_type:complete
MIHECHIIPEKQHHLAILMILELLNDEGFNYDDLNLWLTSNQAILIGAYVNKELVGSLMFCYYKNISYIQTLCVKSYYRKRGIGKSLVNNSVIIRPEVPLIAKVSNNNNTAKNIFDSCNFQICKSDEIPHELSDPPNSTHLFYKFKKLDSYWNLYTDSCYLNDRIRALYL